MFKTNCKCPRCGGILYTQTEYGDYSYQCQNCDEDFYDFEVTDTEESECFCACRMYGSRISDRRSMLYNSNSGVQGIRES